MFRSNSTKRPCEVFLITAVIFVFVSLIVLSKTGVAQIKGLLSASQKGAAILDFEDVKAGALPLEWKIEATNQKGPFATWQVIKDMSALSGEKVLALTSTNHNSSGTF
ncbi:MAG: hypothetical protein HZB54_09285, partial [Deltaproteobacteria bacterium]|nr:hypothetical protein [Deltaproteobacteria bacterium]